MWCPICCEKTRVLSVETGEENLRVRKCEACGKRFTTVERIEYEPMEAVGNGEFVDREGRRYRQGRDSLFAR